MQDRSINAVNKKGEPRVGACWCHLLRLEREGCGPELEWLRGYLVASSYIKTSIGCVFMENLGHQRVHAVSCRLRESKGTVV